MNYHKRGSPTFGEESGQPPLALSQTISDSKAPIATAFDFGPYSSIPRLYS
jgi:hypothetical protein